MEELSREPELNNEEETVTATETRSESKTDPVLRFEDAVRAEREVSTYAASVTSTEAVVKPAEDRMFSKKVDKKKKLYMKRVKIVTSVYATVVGLLLLLTGVNVATLVTTSRSVTTDTETIKSNSEQIEVLEEQAGAETTDGSIYVTLNQPRDYSKEKTELTFLDKVTILIRNLFG